MESACLPIKRSYGIKNAIKSFQKNHLDYPETNLLWSLSFAFASSLRTTCYMSYNWICKTWLKTAYWWPWISKCLLGWIIATICIKPLIKTLRKYPAGIYLLKVNNRNTKTKCEICSKLTIKILERRQWRRSGIFIVNFGRSGIFIVNFEHISHVVLVFPTLTLNM